eukprot:CAMPEP_0197519568 /NCGR_PEP_ID=MMETSP1318-20131121/4835_1 /TAXON_ID=552666 /ORGANISM="Partenskyella glossopodia, Strain RCC365" /LENGTH=140 /DNA_ID=CAMNT_0043070613 /DNA_START=112 /DNA_END=532 /DNA_ORIENTATION=+
MSDSIRRYTCYYLLCFRVCFHALQYVKRLLFDDLFPPWDLASLIALIDASIAALPPAAGGAATSLESPACSTAPLLLGAPASAATPPATAAEADAESEPETAGPASRLIGAGTDVGIISFLVSTHTPPPNAPLSSSRSSS